MVGSSLLLIANFSIKSLGLGPTLMIGSAILLVEMIFEFTRVEWGLFRFTTQLFKHSEVHGFSALTNGLAVSLIVLALFERHLAFAALSAAVLGDAAAAIVGMTVGRHHCSFSSKKTWEGFAAHVAVGTILAALFVTPLQALLISLAASTLELASSKIDDNFFVPLATAFAALGITALV